MRHPFGSIPFGDVSTAAFAAQLIAFWLRAVADYSDKNLLAQSRKSFEHFEKFDTLDPGIELERDAEEDAAKEAEMKRKQEEEAAVAAAAAAAADAESATVTTGDDAGNAEAPEAAADEAPAE